MCVILFQMQSNVFLKLRELLGMHQNKITMDLLQLGSFHKLMSKICVSWRLHNIFCSLKVVGFFLISIMCPNSGNHVENLKVAMET